MLHVPADRYGDDAPLQPIQLGGLEGTSDYEEPDENSQHNNVNPGTTSLTPAVHLHTCMF